MKKITLFSSAGALHEFEASIQSSQLQTTMGMLVFSHHFCSQFQCSPLHLQLPRTLIKKWSPRSYMAEQKAQFSHLTDLFVDSIMQASLPESIIIPPHFLDILTKVFAWKPFWNSFPPTFFFSFSFSCRYLHLPQRRMFYLPTTEWWNCNFPANYFRFSHLLYWLQFCPTTCLHTLSSVVLHMQ